MTQPTPGPKRECAHRQVHHQHGTKRAYDSDACRCDPCRAASAAYGRKLRRRQAEAQWNGRPWSYDGCGVRRRLQALACMGWSHADLYGLLGYADEASISDLKAASWHTPEVHHAVAALYDRIWSLPGPGRYRARVQRYAQRMGWVPPLAWDDEDLDDPAAKPHVRRESNWNVPVDEIAVERAVAGSRVKLTTRERALVQARLEARQLSAAQIAERIGCATRNVQKRRAKGRAA